MSDNKQTIVFLPGWGFKASIWHSLATQLPHSNHLFYDLPQEQLNLFSISEAIGNSLPDDCILIAWSFSGLIATSICHQFPNKISHCITVAATPKFASADDWFGVDQKIMTNFKHEAHTNLYRLMKKFQRLAHPGGLNDHMIDLENQTSLLFYLDLLFSADVRDLYSSFSKPVLHIFGDNDSILPTTSAQQIATSYPNHQTQIILGAGHAPFITHMQEFVQCINAFINL